MIKHNEKWFNRHKTIKPFVRNDGISFVDQYHFYNGQPIKLFVCTDDKCKYTTTETGFIEEDETNPEMVAEAHVTGGFYGPNGNGFTYGCPKCEGGMLPKDNTYNTLKQFTEGHQ